MQKNDKTQKVVNVSVCLTSLFRGGGVLRILAFGEGGLNEV